MFRFGSLIKRKRELKYSKGEEEEEVMESSKRERLMMRGGVMRRGDGDFISVKGH